MRGGAWHKVNGAEAKKRPGKGKKDKRKKARPITVENGQKRMKYVGDRKKTHCTKQT